MCYFAKFILPPSPNHMVFFNHCKNSKNAKWHGVMDTRQETAQQIKLMENKNLPEKYIKKW